MQLTAAIPAWYGINYNVNYKNEKFNIFSNFRYRKIEGFGDASSLRTNFEANEIASILDQRNDLDRKWSIFNIYFGGDYYLDDKNTLTLSYNYRNNIFENESNFKFDFFDNNLNLDKSLTAVQFYKEPQEGHQLDLNYVKDFEKEGQKLSVNLQYTLNNEDENDKLTEEQGFPISAEVINLASRNIEGYQDLLIQTDLKTPLTEKSFFEVGMKGEIRQIDSDYKVWENTVLIDSLNNVLKSLVSGKKI